MKNISTIAAVALLMTTSAAFADNDPYQHNPLVNTSAKEIGAEYTFSNDELRSETGIDYDRLEALAVASANRQKDIVEKVKGVLSDTPLAEERQVVAGSGGTADSGKEKEELDFPAIFAVQNALAGLEYIFAEGDTTAISTTLGFHKLDSVAVAFGVAFQTSDSLQFHMGVATDPTFDTVGGNIGLTISF